MRCAMLYLVFSCSCVGICVLMDQTGSTALMLAARNNHIAMVEYLAGRGADMEAKDEVSTALYLIAAGISSATCEVM